MTHHHSNTGIPFPALGDFSQDALPQSLQTLADKWGATDLGEGVQYLDLNKTGLALPQHPAFISMSVLVGIQLGRMSLERDVPQLQATTDCKQNKDQKHINVPVCIQAFQPLRYLLTGELWVTHSICCPGFPAQSTDRIDCSAFDEWSEYGLCPYT